MTLLALLLAASAMSAPVPKDDKVDFTWKLQKGDVFYVTLDTETDAKETPPPRLALAVDRITQRTEGVWKVTVASADADRVALGLEAVAYRSNGSANTGKLDGVTNVADAAGQKLGLVFDSAFRLSKVADGDAWDKLRAKQSQLSGMPTAQGVGRAFEHILRTVPGGLQGNEWKTKADVLDKGAKTSDTWTRRAKVDGVKDGVATVTTETDLDGTNEANGRNVFVPYERKAEKCPGSLTFDTRTGRLVRFEETLTVTGLSGAKDQAIRFDATTKTVATLSAKPPK
jgi:hypothetical protein